MTMRTKRSAIEPIREGKYAAEATIELFMMKKAGPPLFRWTMPAKPSACTTARRLAGSARGASASRNREMVADQSKPSISDVLAAAAKSLFNDNLTRHRNRYLDAAGNTPFCADVDTGLGRSPVGYPGRNWETNIADAERKIEAHLAILNCNTDALSRELQRAVVE